MKTVFVGLIGATLVLIGSVSPAAADDNDERWPNRWADQPLVLDPGVGRLAGNTLGISLTRRQVGEPIFLAPAFYYGFREKLTLAVLHDRGVCWSDGCGSYDDTRAAALYRLLLHERLEIAATGALNVRSFSDPFALGVRAGLTAKARLTKKLAVVFAPEMYVGLIGRSVSDRLDLPFEFGWQFSDRLVGLINTGWNGPMSDFSAAVQIPVGLAVGYRWTKKIEVGAQFLFENFFGRGATFDRRLVLFRLAYWAQFPVID